MVKLFSPEICAAIVARLEVGHEVPQAAEGAGVKPATVRGWIAKGRREGDGEYADFAAAVAKAQDRPKIEAMTPEEHRTKVSEVARGGNVQALKLYWEMILADRTATDDETTDEKPNPLAGVDELARLRSARA